MPKIQWCICIFFKGVKIAKHEDERVKTQDTFNFKTRRTVVIHLAHKGGSLERILDDRLNLAVGIYHPYPGGVLVGVWLEQKCVLR